MRIINSLIVILFMTFNIQAQTTTGFISFVDSLLSDYEKANNPGASLYIQKNNEIIINKGFGLANIEENIHVTSETNFRLASITKQFTAMAILKLIEQGKLKFEYSLTEIFPGFPQYGRFITIKHLLQHTSGLLSYESLLPDTLTVQVKDKDVLDIMMKQTETYFEPGSQFRYSNSGYALLAMIVKETSGKSFAEFLHENIFLPLGMKNTIVHEEGITTVANRAYGYDRIEDKTFEKKDQSLTSAVLGDGGIYSSVNDMLKWIKALGKDELLSYELLKETMTRGILSNGENFDYGYGWRLDRYNDKEMIYHTGSSTSFRNILVLIPDENFLLIFLSNRNEGDTKGMALQMIDKLLEK